MNRLKTPPAALAGAVAAARAAGRLMRTHLGSVKRVKEASQHDVKLELDVRCQYTIESLLRRAFPGISILGEEGAVGDAASEHRWVVDPIDGTVNFTYGIPHACVSIALQTRVPFDDSTLHDGAPRARPRRARAGLRGSGGGAGYRTVVGVVYDPFCDELWTAVRGHSARLNGRPIRVSAKTRLAEAIVSVGFAKEKIAVVRMLATLNRLAHRVRKIRIMGSAALALTYIATGRMDGYVEYGLRLWDIAAGGLIIECAGGQFWCEPVLGRERYRILASNGALEGRLRPYA
ncbi:MAG: inositol monophosphatase [Verrucomicrobia bacterium]|nr:inositol monophosphatase [Verrucomicrobiota bacterium]